MERSFARCNLSPPRDARARPLRAAVAVVLALTLTLVACGEPPAEAPRLNLLLVTLDTTRADHLGVYGWPLPTSPVLDALAARGVVFDRAYAPMGQTFPSHSTMLSGLGPREHGVLDNHRELHERVTTMAQTLRAEGWSTAGFIGAKVLSARTGIHRGFDHWNEEMPEREPGRATASRPADQVVDGVLAWLDGAPPPSGDTVEAGRPSDEPAGDDGAAGEPGPRSEPRPRHEPWFAWVHVFDAHQPFEAPPEAAVGLDPQVVADAILADPARWLGRDELPPAAAVQAIAERWVEYDAEIRHADAQLGRLLDALQARGELERTVVAVVGDHGEGLTTHGEFGHGVNLYDELMRVPLVIAVPDGHGAGVRVTQPFALVSLRPLLEGLLLGGAVGDLDWDTLTSRRALPSTPVFLERPHYSEEGLRQRSGKRADPYVHGPMLAVVHEGWKLLREPERDDQLFDLGADPGESRDVAAEHADVAARLAALLDDWLARHPVVEGGAVELSEERLRELAELGYLK